MQALADTALGDGGNERARLGLDRERSVVLGQALERLEAQIEAVETCVLALEPRHHLEALGIVIETAVGRHGRGERALAGVTEGGMPEVVRQGERFGEVLVEPKDARDRARDLRNFQAMGQPRAVVVAFVKNKNLRLVGETSKR